MEDDDDLIERDGVWIVRERIGDNVNETLSFPAELSGMLIDKPLARSIADYLKNGGDGWDFGTVGLDRL